MNGFVMSREMWLEIGKNLIRSLPRVKPKSLAKLGIILIGFYCFSEFMLMWRVSNVMRDIERWAKLREGEYEQTLLNEGWEFPYAVWTQIAKCEPFEWRGRHFNVSQVSKLNAAAVRILNFHDAQCSFARRGFYDTALLNRNFSDCRKRHAKQLFGFHQEYCEINDSSGWNELYLEHAPRALRVQPDRMIAVNDCKSP
jgi:hypothetical protein